MKYLFIGDIIASQIAGIYREAGFDVDIVYRTNTIYLPDLTTFNTSYSSYDHVWYCVGYGDLLTLTYESLLGFHTIVSSQIDNLLERGVKELIVVIPVLPKDRDGRMGAFIQNSLKAAVCREADCIYELDLNLILDIEFVTPSKGISEEGIKHLSNYLIGKIELCS